MSKSLLKSVFWVTISEIIFNISGYVVHSGVGRILGPADYGRYSLIVTLTTMVIILIGNGIPTAMSKYLSEFFEKKPGMVLVIKRQALILQTILILGVTLLFFFLAPVIALALGDKSLTSLFRLSTLIIPAFAAASFYFYYFTGLHYFNIQSVLKTLRSVFKVIFIVGLAYYFKVEGSVAGYIFAPFFVFIIAYFIDRVLIQKKFKGVKKTEEDFDWKKLVNYAWPLTLFMIFYELFISVDLYLVKGFLHNDYLTGIYNGALTVGRLPYYLFYALVVVMLPVISKTTSEENHEETFRIISSTLRLMLILLFPVVLLLMVFAGPVIQIFYGSAFLEATLPMIIILPGVGFLTIFYVMSFVMNGAGKVKIPMLLSLLGLLLNAGLNILFIPKFGILGSAMGTTLASFLATLVMLYMVGKHFRVFPKLLSLLKIILASGILLLLSFLLPKNVFSLFWGSAILLTVYFGILFSIREIKKEDLMIFRQLIFKKK